MGNLVVKDNALIEASHKLSEVEQRLVLLAIIKAREVGDSIEQLKDKELTIYANDYIEAFNVDRTTAYKMLKQAVLGLFEAKWGYKFINSKNNIAVRHDRFIQSAEYVENEATVKFVFANAIIPMLVELERNFTSYELEQVVNLQSRYAMRLYEFLIRFKANKTLFITLAELRFRFGLIDTEYKAMGDFKKRVINTAIDQINKNTNIFVKVIQHKQGRNITGFTFSFVEIKAKPQKEVNKQEIERDPNVVDLITGLTDSQLARITRSKKFIADYGNMINASSPANQSLNAWSSEMIKKLKLTPDKFTKRTMKEYLDDDQTLTF